MKGEVQIFEAFTDAAIAIAKREGKKKKPKPEILILGLEACLDRGKFVEGLDITSSSDEIGVLSLQAVALSTLSDEEGIRDKLSKLEVQIDEDSSIEDKLRLTSVRIFLGATAQDESVILSIMELDQLLDANPKQVENPLPEVIFALYLTGVLFCVVGETDRALKLALLLENVAHSKNRRTVLILSENLRGRITGQQGKFKEAEIHYKRILSVSKEIASRLGLGIALNNLGSLMLNSIRLEEAFEYLRQANELLDEDAHRVPIVTNLGVITATLGRYEESESYMIQAIDFNEKTGTGIIEPYTWMVVLQTRKNNLKNARTYLKKAKAISKKSKKPNDQASFYHARGILEAAEKKTKQSVRSLSEALQIAKDNDLFDYLVRSILAIVRTYLGAFIDTNDEEYLSQAAYHLEDLIQITKEQELQSLHAETLLLRSDIRMHAGNSDEAKNDLERVAGLASFIDNQRLEELAKSRLLSLSTPSEETTSIDKSVIERNMARVEGFHPARELQDIPSPKIHVLIAINRSSGLPEYVHHFDESLDMDSSILSGFISAITSFAGEMMGSGMIRSINQEGFTLMMEHTSTRIVTLVASEETFDVRYRLHQFAQVYAETFPASYDSVVTSEYSAASELVEDIFSSISQ